MATKSQSNVERRAVIKPHVNMHIEPQIDLYGSEHKIKEFFADNIFLNGQPMEIGEEREEVENVKSINYSADYSEVHITTF